MNGIRIMNASASTAQISHLSKTHPLTKYNQAYHTDINTVNERNNRQPPSALQKNINMHTPQAPSPLSLSNNDEFDEQDSIYDDQDWEDADGDTENLESVNSNFNMRELIDTTCEDGDFIIPLDYIPMIEVPRIPSTADLVDLVMRDDRRKEISSPQVDTRTI